MSGNSKPVLVPRRRFPQFAGSGGWETNFGNVVFDQIANKEHNSDLPVLAITQEHGAIPRDLIDYHVSVAEKSIEGYKVVEVGDFIISLRSFQGGIEYSKYKGICSPAYVILRLKQGSPQFFRQFLKTSRFIGQLTKNLEGLRDGKMVSYKQFSELLLPAPSLLEQQKIADCLVSLDERIAAEVEKLDALKARKKGLTQRLFPAEDETLPRLRFPEFRADPEWIPSKLGDVSQVQSGGTPNRTIKEFWGGSIPWVTTSLIDFNVILEAEECITATGLRESSAKVFPRGTILMAMYGQGKTRGKVAVLGIDAATNQACAALILSQGVETRFAFQSLASSYESIRKISNSGGQENLSAGLISEIPFCYPENKREQEKLADFLFGMDDVISTQADFVDLLKLHKTGLLQQLFPVLDGRSA